MYENVTGKNRRFPFLKGCSRILEIALEKSGHPITAMY
jgi:hypothetical protein